MGKSFLFSVGLAGKVLSERLSDKEETPQTLTLSAPKHAFKIKKLRIAQ